MNHSNRLKNLDLTDLDLEEATYRRLQSLDSADWIDEKHFNLQTITRLTAVLERFRRDQLFRIAHALRAVRYKTAWPTLAADKETLSHAIASHVYSKFYRRIHKRAKPESVTQRENDSWGMIVWQQAKPIGIKGIEDTQTIARRKERKVKELEEKKVKMVETHGASTVEAMHEYTVEGKKEKDMAAKTAKKAAKKAAKKTAKKTTAKASAKKGKTAIDFAAQVVRRSSKPLNTKQIAERAITAGWETKGKTPHATLYTLILREMGSKNGDSRFRKASAGLFESTGK